MRAKQIADSLKSFISSSFQFEKIEKIICDKAIKNFDKNHVIDLVMINVKFEYKYQYKTSKLLIRSNFQSEKNKFS